MFIIGFIAALAMVALIALVIGFTSNADGMLWVLLIVPMFLLAMIGLL